MENDLSPAIYAALGAFVLNIIFCKTIIPKLAALKAKQFVRSELTTHKGKAGTPTMGGIIILLSFTIISLFFVGGHPDNIALILVTLGFGLIGFLDDYIKVIKKRSLGLKANQKMLGQIFVTGAFAAYLLLIRQSPGQTEVFIPFINNGVIDLQWFYVPFLFLVMLGTVNGANFTDGLDGLAAGVTALITAFFLFAAWAMGSPVLPLAGAAAGSLLGFLLFNSYPARIFMGDTGSLALGGFVASIAILLRMPLFLLIVALIYIIEVASVIIQVSYFKKTRRRFFKMAPIHHSFELSGWTETKIVTLFYIVTAILCMVGYLGARMHI